MSEYVDESEQLADDLFQRLDKIERTGNGGLDYAELIKIYNRNLNDARGIVSKCYGKNSAWGAFKEKLDNYQDPENLRNTMNDMWEWYSMIEEDDEGESERLSIIDVTDYLCSCIGISEYAKNQAMGLK